MDHQTPGRVRMKFGSAKGNPELLGEISQKFGAITESQRVEVNSTSGSVVLYDDHERRVDFHKHLRRHGEEPYGEASRPPSAKLDEITGKIEDEAEFLAEHSHRAKVVVHIRKHLDHRLKIATSNTIDLKIGLAAGIVPLSLLEMGAFAATPVWLTFGAFPLNHFVELQWDHALAEKMNRAAPTDAKGVKVALSA